MKYIKSGLACKVANIEQHKLNAYINSGDYPPAPKVGGNGMTRLYSAEDVAALCLFGDLIQTYTVRHAGRLVDHVKAAMEAHPEAEQIALVTLANGSLSAHPAASVDLSSGWMSGGYLRHAMIVDVRNYRERVRRTIEAAPVVIGGEGDD